MEQMLTDLFLKLVNMSISGSFLMGAVVILRLIFKKAPKWVNCLLWTVAGLRLILPFSLESALSLIPSAETVPPEILYEQTPHISSGIQAFNSVVNPVIGEALAPSPGASVNPVQVITIIGAYIWVTGVVVLLAYALISYLGIKRKTATATLLKDNIFCSEAVGSPFVLGLIRPKIFLPYNIEEAEAGYVISHEKAHIKRGDHLIKPLAYLLLCVYWFNPLVWLSYALLCRDIEMACDEKVIKNFDSDSRKAYSKALLSCSINSNRIAACPLAFGEVGVKERIKGVMNYKKPAFWVIIIALLSCAAVAVCFLTDPLKDESDVPFENNDFSPVIDEITADIDFDGKDEHCVLTYGPTSGLYTVVFTATEKGSEKAEYINTFNMPYTGGTAFYKKGEGVQIVCGNSIFKNGQSVKTDDVYLDIKIENGNIALYDGEEKIAYWGEQGIAPSEFFKKLNAVDDAVSKAVLEMNLGKYALRLNRDEYENAKAFEGHNILYRVKDAEKEVLTVYVQTLYREYNLANGEISALASCAEGVEITFKAKEEDGNYEYILKKYRSLGKGDDIENYLPEDYIYDDEETMAGIELEIERQKNAYYGYIDNDLSMWPIISDDSQQLTFIEADRDYLENMLADALNQYEFTEFNYEITALRRVFYNGKFYYYCGYKNESDRVFVFFSGFDLEPIGIIDFNKTLKGGQKCPLVGDDYSLCEKLIREIDKNF